MLYEFRQPYRTIKTKVIYEDIASDVKERFYTSNYGIKSSLPIGLNKKVIGIIKDELLGQFMRKFRLQTNNILFSK